MGKLEAEVNGEPVTLKTVEEETGLKIEPSQCEYLLDLSLDEGRTATYFLGMSAYKNGRRTAMRFTYRYPNFVWRFFAWLLLGVTYHKY